MRFTFTFIGLLALVLFVNAAPKKGNASQKAEQAEQVVKPHEDVVVEREASDLRTGAIGGVGLKNRLVHASQRTSQTLAKDFRYDTSLNLGSSDFMRLRDPEKVQQITSVRGSSCKKICYEEYDLGCFDTCPPFSDLGRVAILPQSPASVKTKFMLLTRKEMNRDVEISYKDDAALAGSTFNPKLPTKFIAHGWIDDGGRFWLRDLGQQLLLAEDSNVFLVDWRGGSRALYAQSVGNTRLVGRQIAQLVGWLGVDPKKVHVLGHSLGAHAAGYAGADMPTYAKSKPGRLTGMDPADPYFENMDIAVRLDPSDGDWVDILHTDAGSIFNIANIGSNNLGLGLWQPSGHVDFYVNGGISQPGCEDKSLIWGMIESGIWEGARQFVACDHMRGYEYSTNAVNSNCPWTGYKCKDWKTFQDGTCLECNSNLECSRAGYHSIESKPHIKDLNKPGENMYFHSTSGDAPYCQWHYNVRLTLIPGKENEKERGNVYVRLAGTYKTTDWITLSDENFFLVPGATYNWLVTSDENLGPMARIDFKWKHNAAWLNPATWHLTTPSIFPEKVRVLNGESQEAVLSCDGQALKSKSERQYKALKVGKDASC